MQDKSSDEEEITAARAPLKCSLKPAPIFVYKEINSLKLPIRSPYGGLVTMVTLSLLSNGLYKCSTSFCTTLIMSAKPAFCAFSLAISTMYGSKSKPLISTPFSRHFEIPCCERSWASLTKLSQDSFSNCFNLKKPKCSR